MLGIFTIILAIIGSIVAWAGEPIGMLCVIPLVVMYVANEIKVKL